MSAPASATPAVEPLDRLWRLAAAFDMLGSSATHDPLPRFLHIAAIQLAAAAGADGSALSKLEDNLLVDTVTYDPRGKRLGAGEVYLVSDYPATRTVLATRSTAVVHVDEPGADREEVRLLRHFGLSSVLLLPIVAGRYTWGLAEVYRESVEPLSAEDVTLARLLTGHLGSLIFQLETQVRG